MAPSARGISAVLLVGGLTIVFVGIAAALGFAPAGFVASAAVIAGLLYAGATWFGGDSGAPLVFSSDLVVVSGPRRGVRVTDLFAPGMRGEVEARCRAAIAGQASGFVNRDGRRIEVAPLTIGGVPYGVLLQGIPAVTPSVA